MKLYQVDAFADVLFAGNPAAVCPVTEWPAPELMQRIAAENNLSETAFIAGHDGQYRLRWFTPTVEVDLCGHATLASAHVLWEDGHLAASEPALFDTLSGRLSAEREGALICMDFPATPVSETAPSSVPSGLAEALGCRPRFVGRNQFDFLLELGDEDEVRALAPDMARLGALETRGVIVTARGSDHDFVSRFFAPAIGVPEDPVTGSAHCALAPYWATKLGRDTLRAYQASPRGGEVHVVLTGDRVKLKGSAVTTLRGELFV
jgi:PhzF family phenazine biosynthesis protein